MFALFLLKMHWTGLMLAGNPFLNVTLVSLGLLAQCWKLTLFMMYSLVTMALVVDLNQYPSQHAAHVSLGIIYTITGYCK